MGKETCDRARRVTEAEMKAADKRRKCITKESKKEGEAIGRKSKREEGRGKKEK